MKNLTELKGNWNEQKAKFKQKFAVLTDNGLKCGEVDLFDFGLNKV